MKQKVFKYQLPIKEKFDLDLPIGAKVIRIDGVDGFLWMWCLVNIEAETESRTFYMFKTGGIIPEYLNEMNYLGCGAIWVQMELMLYVFESTKVEFKEVPNNTALNNIIETFNKKMANIDNKINIAFGENNSIEDTLKQYKEISQELDEIVDDEVNNYKTIIDQSKEKRKVPSVPKEDRACLNEDVNVKDESSKVALGKFTETLNNYQATSTKYINEGNIKLHNLINEYEKTSIQLDLLRDQINDIQGIHLNVDKILKEILQSLIKELNLLPNRTDNVQKTLILLEYLIKNAKIRI